MSKIDIVTELIDIFNIPRDGSNIKSEDVSQEGAYADVINDADGILFSDKAESLNKKIAQSSTSEAVECVAQPPVVTIDEAPKIEVKAEPTKPKSLNSEGSKNDSAKPSDHERILSEAIPTKRNPAPQPQQVERPPTIDTVVVEDGDSDESDVAIRAEHECVAGSPQHTEEQVVVIDSEGWCLQSPAPKYNQFYAEKKAILPSLLRGGKIPIEQYRQELKQASIDTRVDMYDHDRIGKKMEEIRGWQTRIMDIRGHVLVQYFRWKRSLDLFRGLLARAEYAKPAICQEGVNFSHLRDFELYYCDLEYLYDFTKELLGNLMANFESLSRQVTLSMPLKSVERHEQPSLAIVSSPPSKPAQSKTDLSGFDSLENSVDQKVFAPEKSNTNSSSNAKKKTMEWGDVD
jgi:hypothetical protein